MKFVITRTSSRTPKIKTFNTLQDIIKFYEDKGQIIFKENFWYNEPVEDCIKYCEVSEDVAKQIVSTKYEIEIYDDYRE